MLHVCVAPADVPLELEPQAALSHMTWMLGIQLDPLDEQDTVFNTEPLYPATLQISLSCLWLTPFVHILSHKCEGEGPTSGLRVCVSVHACSTEHPSGWLGLKARPFEKISFSSHKRTAGCAGICEGPLCSIRPEPTLNIALASPCLLLVQASLIDPA